MEWTSLPGDVSTPQSSNVLSVEREYDPGDPVNVYGLGASSTITVPELPATGFAPGRVTDLPPDPQRYESLGSLWLEVPALGIEIPIIGVPLNDQGWNLDWLGSQAGYLAGTAYPTWSGNTGITAHAILPDGTVGPFHSLADLRWGDRAYLHAFGRTYIYEVRSVRSVRPSDLSVLRHEELDWLTLLTCSGYSEASDGYLRRVAVRAVLMEVR